MCGVHSRHIPDSLMTIEDDLVGQERRLVMPKSGEGLGGEGDGNL